MTVEGMKRMRRLILLTAVLMALGLNHVRAANETPGQWRDHCAPDEITKEKGCTAYAVLKGAGGKMVAALFASAMGGGVYRVQISGSDSAKWSQAELQVDDNPAVATTRCKGAICTFPAAASDRLIKQMMVAREAKIRLTDPAAPERSAAMPLTGFAEAFGRAERRLDPK